MTIEQRDSDAAYPLWYGGARAQGADARTATALLVDGGREDGDSDNEPAGDARGSAHVAKRPLLASATYSLGFIVQRAIGLLLVPLYTRAVTPSQYGVLGLLISIGAGLAVLFALGMDSIVTRNYFQLEAEPERREQFIASIWRFLVIYPLTASVVVCVAALPFSTVVSGASRAAVAMMFLSSALAIAGTTVPLSVLRAKQDLRGYLRVTATVALATPALTWLFVVALHQGVSGWFFAATIANGATLAVAAATVPWQRGVPYSRAAVRGAVLFSLPLLPHFLSHWALAVADRLVISGFVSPASLGVYTLAANLAAPMFAVLTAINAGFIPIYGRAGLASHDKVALAQGVKLQINLTIAITLAAVLLGQSAVTILAPPSYRAAGDLVAWLMLGNGFVGLYFIPMNGATIAAGRRMFAFVATVAAATVNIVLLVIFVPSGGILAAAIADAVAYFVLLVLMAVWAHSKPNPVTYDFRAIAVSLALAGVAYAGCIATTPSAPWPGVAVEVAWVVAYAVCVAAIGFRRQLRRLLRWPGRSAE